ncbi:unnamed protein product [Ectocarpus sp. 13 AM-2016]
MDLTGGTASGKGDGGGMSKTPQGGRVDGTTALPLAALECAVCLSLVCEPVSLSCGHSFCRVCLVNTLRRNKKKCPTCRAVCHNSAEDQPEDVMLANIAQTCFPELAAARLKEVEAEREKFMTVLPVFYYNVPMFPGESLQLHLFEPRYKLMMKRVVNTSRRFAYVPNYSNYVATIGDVALIAQLVECEFLSDGRVLLKAKLISRQTVIDHFVEEGTQGLHFCRVEARGDEPPSNEQNGNASARVEELHARTRRLILDAIGPFMSEMIERYGEIPASAESFSQWAAAVLPMPVREKHAMLSGRSTADRLVACERHLASLTTGRGRVPPALSEPRDVTAVADAFTRHISDAGHTPESVAAAVSAGPGDGSREEEGGDAGSDED